MNHGCGRVNHDCDRDDHGCGRGRGHDHGYVHESDVYVPPRENVRVLLQHRGRHFPIHAALKRIKGKEKHKISFGPLQNTVFS